VRMGVWKKKRWDLEVLIVVPEASEKRLSRIISIIIISIYNVSFQTKI